MQHLARITADMIIAANGVSRDKKEMLAFGLEIIFNELLKLISLAILALMTGMFKEVFWVTTAIVFFRTFSGGVHNTTLFRCTVTFLGSSLALGWIAGSYLPEIWLLERLIIIGFILILVIFLIWAPGRTPTKPFKNGQPEKLKKLSLINTLTIGAVLYILVPKFPGEVFAVFLGAVWQSFSVMPVGYAFFLTVDRWLEPMEKGLALIWQGFKSRGKEGY